MNENKNFLIPNPKSIICIGLNYADHIAETSLATHDFPEIFMKTSNALAGNHDTITIEDETFHYDYEGELVIIIGKSGKNIFPEHRIPLQNQELFVLLHTYPSYYSFQSKYAFELIGKIPL